MNRLPHAPLMLFPGSGGGDSGAGESTLWAQAAGSRLLLPKSKRVRSASRIASLSGAIADGAIFGGAAPVVDVTDFAYDSVSHSVSSQDTNANEIALNAAGTVLFLLGDSSDSVHQYSLSAAWDLSSISYDTVDLDISTEETKPFAMFVKEDGTKMYIAGQDNDTVYQYSLSTAWDLSTASYDSVSKDISGQTTSPRAIEFNPSGTKMFVLDVNGSATTLYEYDLSTAWDVSTATYNSVSYAATDVSNGNSMDFNGDGSQLVIAGGTKTIYQYSLTTPYSLGSGSISYDSVSNSLAPNGGTVGFQFRPSDYERFFVLSVNSIFQWSVT